MAHDLPRESGTTYARLNSWRGRYVQVEYAEAHEAWKGGEPVYTKNGNGYVQEVQERPWTMAEPYCRTED